MYTVEIDEKGNIVSITKVIEPPSLVISDEEYFKELFKVQEIMRAVHTALEVQDGRV